MQTSLNRSFQRCLSMEKYSRKSKSPPKPSDSNAYSDQEHFPQPQPSLRSKETISRLSSNESRCLKSKITSTSFIKQTYKPRSVYRSQVKKHDSCNLPKRGHYNAYMDMSQKISKIKNMLKPNMAVASAIGSRCSKLERATYSRALKTNQKARARVNRSYAGKISHNRSNTFTDEQSEGISIEPNKPSSAMKIQNSLTINTDSRKRIRVSKQTSQSFFKPTRKTSKGPKFSKIDEKLLKDIQLVHLNTSSMKILSNYLKVLNLFNGSIEAPEEIAKIMFLFKKSYRKIIDVTEQINDDLSAKATERSQSGSIERICKSNFRTSLKNNRKKLVQLKIDSFGKGKLSTTALMGSFQTQVRPFVKFLIKVFNEVKKTRNDGRKSDRAKSQVMGPKKEEPKPLDMSFTIEDKDNDYSERERKDPPKPHKNSYSDKVIENPFHPSSNTPSFTQKREVVTINAPCRKTYLEMTPQATTKTKESDGSQTDSTKDTPLDPQVQVPRRIVYKNNFMATPPMPHLHPEEDPITGSFSQHFSKFDFDEKEPVPSDSEGLETDYENSARVQQYEWGTDKEKFKLELIRCEKPLPENTDIKPTFSRSPYQGRALSEHDYGIVERIKGMRMYQL